MKYLGINIPISWTRRTENISKKSRSVSSSELSKVCQSIIKHLVNRRKELTVLIYTVVDGNVAFYKKLLSNVLKTDSNGFMIATEQEKQDFKAVYSTVFP